MKNFSLKVLTLRLKVINLTLAFELSGFLLSWTYRGFQFQIFEQFSLKLSMDSRGCQKQTEWTKLRSERNVRFKCISVNWCHLINNKINWNSRNTVKTNISVCEQFGLFGLSLTADYSNENCSKIPN